MSQFDVRAVIHVPKRVQDALRRLDEDWKPHYERVLDKVLPLPSPKELGKSTSNALPMNFLLDEEDDKDTYTWEKWGDEMKRDHPIAWFLRREAPKPFKRAWKKVDDAFYWLKCHTLPSYNFHTLDMRNPGGGIEWDYGWRDRCDVMLWACFKLLVEYVEKEQPINMEAACRSQGLNEAQAREQYGTQYEGSKEVMALYHWWKTGRIEDDRKTTDLYRQIAQKTDKEAKRIATSAWREAVEAFEANDQKMLERLIAIRGYLWT